MKKQFTSQLCWLFVLAATFLSCKDNDVAQAVQVFKVGEEPSALKYADLIRDETNFVFKSPLDDGPGTDETGANHSVDKQPRPDVMFLIGTFGGKAERTLVIPRDRYVFVNIYNGTNWYYDEDPCDPDFHPASGQSPLDFLKGYIPDLRANSTVSVVLNGQELVNNANRDGFYSATEVFSFKPHKDFDYPDCDYSAKTAKGYSEGYSALLKLPPGTHTLVVKASDVGGNGFDPFETEVLWKLTVQ